MQTATESATTTGVVEWAPFRLKAGVAEATLLRASKALQRDFLASQPGFVKRELLRGTDGQWVDLVYWRDEASAKAVMPAIADSAACQAYFHLMEGMDSADASAGVLHLHRVRSY